MGNGVCPARQEGEPPLRLITPTSNCAQNRIAFLHNMGTELAKMGLRCWNHAVSVAAATGRNRKLLPGRRLCMVETQLIPTRD